MLALLLRLVCIGSTTFTLHFCMVYPNFAGATLFCLFLFYYYLLALVEPIPFNFWFLFSQLVVEKMLASEGIKKSDLTREEFTARVWEWKDKYAYFSHLPLLFLSNLRIFVFFLMYAFSCLLNYAFFTLHTFYRGFLYKNFSWHFFPR